MSATATPDAPEAEVAEEEAPRGTPPAKSWAVYTYDGSQVGPDAKPCHIYGYADGSPLSEQQANDLAVMLSGTRNLTVMVLPVEDESAAPKGVLR